MPSSAPHPKLAGGSEALLAVTAFLAVAGAQDKTSRDPSGPPTDRVKAIQKERVAVLKEAADISQKLAANHRIEIREALEDRVAALKAPQADLGLAERVGRTR